MPPWYLRHLVIVLLALTLTVSDCSYSLAGPSVGMLRGMQLAASFGAMRTGLSQLMHLTALAMEGELRNYLLLLRATVIISPEVSFKYQV